MFLPAQRQRQGKSTKLRGLNLIPRPLLANKPVGSLSRGVLARAHTCPISRAARFCVKCGNNQGSVTSGTAYIKAVTIMSLEDVLKTIENDSGEVRNPELYYFLRIRHSVRFRCEV
jgi:hypothetical protein